MTKSELDTLDSVFLAPLALSLNQYFGTIFSERKLLWICMVRFFFIMKSYNEGLVLLKLADTVLILINTGPSNVKDNKDKINTL